ncbi:hypothetical protein AVEN_9856-1 [Araneus ventricosus]|uniref:Uncharacterized protein n=1 Tax=Araneus ventricosus TaxID=182803 RepID=A0A4Y2EGG3_ARAVE|nr:hypothetical protein AVEN_9856-1 [Araneus ventricosus]
MVSIATPSGREIKARVLLDSGASGTFITETFASQLNLPRENARYPITGLANTEIGFTKWAVDLVLRSENNVQGELKISALELDKLTAPLPPQELKLKDFPHLADTKLADPSFIVPGQIDLIIGADYFFSTLLPGQVEIIDNASRSCKPYPRCTRNHPTPVPDKRERELAADLQLNHVVILKDERRPAAHLWTFGKDVHPHLGGDELFRIATIWTTNKRDNCDNPWTRVPLTPVQAKTEGRIVHQISNASMVPISLMCYSFPGDILLIFDFH